MSSIQKRPMDHLHSTEGLLFTEDLWEVFRGVLWVSAITEDLWKVFYTQKTSEWSSNLGRPVQGLLFLEDQCKVFYPQKIWGRPLIHRKPVEGILSTEGLWKAFYSYKLCGRYFIHKASVEDILSTEDLWKNACLLWIGYLPQKTVKGLWKISYP